MEITEDGKLNMDMKPLSSPMTGMTGNGTALFDHIAEYLSIFLDKWNTRHLELPLGFTFSFPCRQEGVARGVMVKWTKGNILVLWG